MKRLLQLLLLAGAVAAGFWLWTVLFPDPQRVIHDRLLRLASLATFSSNEGNIARVANVEKMGAMFADDTEVLLNDLSSESFHLTNRGEVTQAAISARSAVGSLKVKFADIRIIIGPDRESASANVTARADVAGQADPIFAEFKFTFKKVKRDWLITRVESVRTLK